MRVVRARVLLPRMDGAQHHVLGAAAVVLGCLAVDEKLDGGEAANLVLGGKVLLLGGVDLWGRHSLHVGVDPELRDVRCQRAGLACSP